MSNVVYIIELPGKQPREVTNIKFDVVRVQVEILGGKIYPKPITKIEPPIITTTEENNYTEPTLKFFSPTPKYTMYTHTDYKTYTKSEVLNIVQEIKQKYFEYNTAVMNCRIRFNSRFRSRLLGRAWARMGYIELAERLLWKDSAKLHQVIFHELCHIEFPGQGHRGMEFRYKEKNNPFRNSKTNRLTCVD